MDDVFNKADLVKAVRYLYERMIHEPEVFEDMAYVAENPQAASEDLVAEYARIINNMKGNK